MSNRPFRPAIVSLLVGALLLPVVLAVVLGVAALLRVMGDLAGGRVLGWLGLAIGILWVVDLVCLLVVHAAASLGREPCAGDAPRSEQ